MDTQVFTQQEQREKLWNRLAYYGENIVKRGEDVKWKTGDLARMVSERWNRNKGTLLAFAVAIKMSRPRAIYEYHEVAEFFPKSARRELIEDCQMLSWSHFRAAYRHARRASLSVDEAIPLLWSANDNMLSVDEFEEKLRNDPNGNWITKRERIVAEIAYINTPENGAFDEVGLRIPKGKGQVIRDKANLREFIIYVALRWMEECVDSK